MDQRTRRHERADKPKPAICILGSGPTTTAFLHGLIASVPEAAWKDLEIQVVERGACFGRGTPFQLDSAGPILNTTPLGLSLVPDQPADFLDWVVERMPELRGSGMDVYLPRSFYGEYVSQRFFQAINSIRGLGARVRLLEGEAVGMRPLGSGDRPAYEVSLADGRRLEAGWVFLGIGPMPAERCPELRGHAGYFASPYPCARLTETIPREARVAILGSRLSAVDAVLALRRAGHQAPIAMFSRGGKLPSVKGRADPHVPRYFTVARLRAIAESRGGYLRLSDLARAFGEELRLVTGRRAVLRDALVDDLDVIDRFKADLAAARASGSPLQRVFFGAVDAAIFGLALLEDSEKARYLHEHQSHLSCRMAGMPLQSAEVIAAMIDEGNLESVAGLRSVAAATPPAGAPSFVVESAAGSRTYDFVIDASGYKSNVRSSTSRLVRDLLDQGVAPAPAYCGLRTDVYSGSLACVDGRTWNRAVLVGGLTEGSMLLTNGVESGTRQAWRITSLIANELGADTEWMGAFPERRKRAGAAEVAPPVTRRRRAG